MKKEQDGEGRRGKKLLKYKQESVHESIQNMSYDHIYLELCVFSVSYECKDVLKLVEH